MKKFILFTSFFGFLLTPFSFAWAKQNVLQDLTYLQRAGTKLVDLNYRLTLETGQTAEVTFTFSHDNGSTFPVACRSITGDAGKGLTSGYKSAVWDAGVDWPLQFTDLGRIKATCLVTGKILLPMMIVNPLHSKWSLFQSNPVRLFIAQHGL